MHRLHSCHSTCMHVPHSCDSTCMHSLHSGHSTCMHRLHSGHSRRMVHARICGCTGHHLYRLDLTAIALLMHSSFCRRSSSLCLTVHASVNIPAVFEWHRFVIGLAPTPYSLIPSDGTQECLVWDMLSFDDAYAWARMWSQGVGIVFGNCQLMVCPEFCRAQSFELFPFLFPPFSFFFSHIAPLWSILTTTALSVTYSRVGLSSTPGLPC
jgi:hypothetical protein